MYELLIVYDDGRKASGYQDCIVAPLELLCSQNYDGHWKTGVFVFTTHQVNRSPARMLLCRHSTSCLCPLSCLSFTLYVLMLL